MFFQQEDEMMDVAEDEVQDNIVNFANVAGSQTAKDLLLMKGKVLRNKKQVNADPFEELLQARITSLLSPEAYEV